MTQDPFRFEAIHFDLLDKIAALTTVCDSTNILAAAISAYGLCNITYFATSLPRLTDNGPFVISTYSSDWAEHYRRSDFVRIDPVLRQGFMSTLPLDWRELRLTTPCLQRFFGEAREFGVGRQGLSFPIRGPSGERVLFVLNADDDDAEWTRRARVLARDFYALSCAFHEKLITLSGVPRDPVRLSPREIECLKWSAAGKTVPEIGIILTLSDRTVRDYLDSARVKLGTANIAQSVVRACTLDLISSS